MSLPQQGLPVKQFVIWKIFEPLKVDSECQVHPFDQHFIVTKYFPLTLIQCFLVYALYLHRVQFLSSLIILSIKQIRLSLIFGGFNMKK